MIIGEGTAHLFDELNDAVEALAGDRIVCLNAHTSPSSVPTGAIVYNQENVPLQVQPFMFEGHEVWDFSERNCEAWRAAGREATHVPVGYHPSMVRFAMRPWGERTIDVVFMGVMNERRAHILAELRERGLRVAVIPPGIYGKQRDDILARSKLAIAPMYYPDGVFGTLRAAHCAANKLPLVAEVAADTPSWAAMTCSYDRLVDRVMALVEDRIALEALAQETYDAFRSAPMALPEPKAKPPSPWAPLHAGPLDEAGITAMYDVARGEPVSERPRVHIAVPFYRESWRVGRAVMTAIERIEEDLAHHGVASERTTIEGDSLICRMRQRVCHAFLMSTATHLLFCDGDIEPLDPTCVRHMLASGHDVVAGAAPFKEPNGRVVCNVWPGSLDEGATLSLKAGCLDVQDVGTGFLLVSRAAIVRLMAAHPELQHWSQGREDEGVPLWAIFDTGVVDRVYQSEDYMFCRRWQALGGRVYVYVPATFRHWGEFGYEGSFAKHYGLERR